jgi:hypothetical protein
MENKEEVIRHGKDAMSYKVYGPEAIITAVILLYKLVRSVVIL